MDEAAKDFAAGTMAGMMCKYVEYPLDTIKVRLQDSNSKYTSSLNCFTRMLREEGVRGFYKGVTAPLCGCMLETAIAFAVYGRILALIKEWRVTRKEQSTIADNFLAGSVAGVAIAFVLTPVELVKCRMQVQDTLPPSKRLYHSTLDCAKKICQRDGIRGLFLGLFPCAVREIPGNGIWYGVYESAKSYLCKDIPATEVPMYKVAFAGSLAGASYWSAFFPADVVKTRIQIDSAYKDHTLWKGLGDVYREGGFRALYKGWGITISRAIPAHAALFVTFEFFKSSLDSAFESKEVHHRT